ncbi:MAG TPA: triple tyrosine motif-containing protein, partial [Cyclobacteriaceae bacterium]|nr:triple tyrosine motif-containing protein [Cyclobacteriaceae bacterium]
AAPQFPGKLNIQYSYWLKGLEEDWSPWQDMSFKEYNSLRPGHYVFHVRARSLVGEQSSESAYYFSVLPVWYQTTVAIIVFFMATIFVLLFSALMVRRKIEKVRLKTQEEEREKRKVLELELERMTLAREKEAIKKDKDQLEEDVIYKSKELANYTMLLIKKRELLAEIQESLKDLRENVRNDSSRQKMRDLVRKIKVNLESEEHLQIFEANFERVHHEFFVELKTAYPDLTQKELRLCAFVRMNLTNKEIASILNISVRGVETARYRLRKRLSLNHKDDMAGFLEKLHSSTSESVESEEESLSD